MTYKITRPHEQIHNQLRRYLSLYLNDQLNVQLNKWVVNEQGLSSKLSVTLFYELENRILWAMELANYEI
jgi:hypothetical protein